MTRQDKEFLSRKVIESNIPFGHWIILYDSENEIYEQWEIVADLHGCKEYIDFDYGGSYTYWGTRIEDEFEVPVYGDNYFFATSKTNVEEILNNSPREE
jgi:hypothetical protein